MGRAYKKHIDSELHEIFRALRVNLPTQHIHTLAKRVWLLAPPGTTVEDIVRVGKKYPRVIKKRRRHKRPPSPFDALRID
jgi:hypothetical protein